MAKKKGGQQDKPTPKQQNSDNKQKQANNTSNNTSTNNNNNTNNNHTSGTNTNNNNNNNNNKNTSGTNNNNNTKNPQQATTIQPNQPEKLSWPRELPFDPYDEDETKKLAFLKTLPGPTDWSNWVIPDLLLVGAIPKNSAILKAYLNQGISTFICLMQDEELQRCSKVHYFEIAKSIVKGDTCNEKDRTEFPGLAKLRVKDLNLINFPIRDKCVSNDENAVMELVRKILDLLSKGQKIYLHCRGGHGRTGVFVSLLLSVIYDLDAYLAIEMCQLFHDQRPKSKGYKSPETHDQNTQVYKLALELKKTK